MPTLTCACEYANGIIRTASNAKYFTYRILTSWSGSPILSEVQNRSNLATYLNNPGDEKLRKPDWLISTIPLNFNHLGYYRPNAFNPLRCLQPAARPLFVRSTHSPPKKLKLPRKRGTKNALMSSVFSKQCGPR